MTVLHLSIDTASDKWAKAFPRMKAKIELAAAAAFRKARKPAALRRRACDVNIVLTDDAGIKDLNKTYRGKNKATNVLSFPQLDIRKFKPAALRDFPPLMPVPLGDVILAQETILRECRLQNKTMESHVIHLVVHGMLHLLGYDHVRPREAEDMEKLECDILKTLGYDNPYDETATPTGKTRSHGRQRK